MTTFITLIILAAIIIAAIVVVFAVFYQRATREISLIRTGIGGRKVIMDGGTLVLPYLHDVARVNMQTLRLEVHRHGEAALITNDRLRVDVGVEFYVSVEPTEDAIARASQTLGNRTFGADKLRDLIEGKLIDTLRAIAARMTMDELHEKRAEFVSEVSVMLEAPLARNGLALESVSLTAMDQTPFSALDENNAFNAVGMRKLAEVIAKSKKERAEIDSESDVAVHRSAMEASKRRLEIDLEEQQAHIAQVQELERLRAAQLSEIAERKADSELAVNAARIKMEQEIRATDISREEVIRTAEIRQAQTLEIAEQDRAIAIAKKTQEESKAVTAADLAKAEAVNAAEAIGTARALSEAQRRKDVAVLNAQQDSEISAHKLVSQAKAEAEASVARAKTTLEDAKAEAEAAKLRIASLKAEMGTRAEGQKALNEAENVFSQDIIALKIDLAKLEAFPKIVEQMVKPAEKIDSIRINHVTGLTGGGGASGSADSGATKTPINQALDSILDMAVQLPALKKIGEELGLSIDDSLKGVTGKDKA
ncbi:flotillin family protein [Roseibium algae]|uniref:Flotillin domain-containing protein n=1 Tax=Roseibium algae TaxID=3123038 RepID=A0ABU8TGI5_9HYPH